MTHDETPLVSVIVPIYNVEKYLKKCIESIRTQLYNHIEIILVDDGSLDGSAQICDGYQQLDERIKVIHKVNGGLSDARNAGIDVCVGQYILFVDSDDYIHPYMIKGMMDVAINEGADIVECAIQDVDEVHRADFKIDRIPYNIRVLNHEQAVEGILDYKLKIVAWNKLYKKSLFVKLRFPVGKLHEDEFLIPFLVDMCSTYVLIDNKYYAYVNRENSIMNSPYNKKRLDIIEIFEERLNYFNKKYDNKYNEIIKYHFWVACVRLKAMMGEQYYNSKVEDVYTYLYNELITSKKVKVDKKIKAIANRFIPFNIIKKMKQRA
ncbi:MAG: glycosyltransferase [Lachnospiraceae bacterium]|nr:glycosyltransferase [Lachnospiraceae bacterium]